jgi:threonylcarbamoyladenosine tRNA methylthiotransferase MtaB
MVDYRYTELEMKYSILTFGCRVNQADSLSIERQLRARGGCAVAVDKADLVVVNTCSVTANADQGARQAIRRIARTNPSARIVATGCYATRIPADLSALPSVVAVVPNTDKEQLVDHLKFDSFLTTSDRFGSGEGACGEMIQPGTAGRTSYMLRVQTGCDETCSYCIIPTTRGQGRSLPLSQIIDEIDRIWAEGFREVAITGVHLGSYGRDLAPQQTLLTLLRLLDAHPAPLFFRLSSLEPMDCTSDIVDLVARSGRFAPHFHLPLQHTSNHILEAMRRPYTFEYYARLVTSIRDRMPHAAIGTDLIVGFPSEKDKDTDATLCFLDGSPLTYLHVFPYSDRPGTDATRFKGKVPGAMIRERSRAVREMGASLALRFQTSQLNAVRPGLTIEGGKVAVTDNYLKVRIPPGLPDNQRVQVRITGVGDTLTGEVVDFLGS